MSGVRAPGGGCTRAAAPAMARRSELARLPLALVADQAQQAAADRAARRDRTARRREPWRRGEGRRTVRVRSRSNSVISAWEMAGWGFMGKILLPPRYKRK